MAQVRLRAAARRVLAVLLAANGDWLDADHIATDADLRVRQEGDEDSAVLAMVEELDEAGWDIEQTFDQGATNRTWYRLVNRVKNPARPSPDPARWRWAVVRDIPDTIGGYPMVIVTKPPRPDGYYYKYTVNDPYRGHIGPAPIGPFPTFAAAADAGRAAVAGDRAILLHQTRVAVGLSPENPW